MQDKLLEQGKGESRRSFLANNAARYGLLTTGLSAAQYSDGARYSGLNYHPRGMRFWDAWYFRRGTEAHVMHLQKLRPGSQRDQQDDGTIGHAVSTDLLTWRELPVALYKGPPGSIDDEDLWTGCTYPHEDTYYLYYTARSKKERGIQRICLATSRDTVIWIKRPGAVIEADPRWYVPGSCRDLTVVQDPQSGEFHGFYATALPREELIERGVIAHVRSRDLIHWTHEPPAFAPGHYAIVECPDVFLLGGRWWMICNAGNLYGARAPFTDRYATWGTVYASANEIGGPYRTTNDLLVGSTEFNPYCSRTLLWNDTRLLFYGQGERSGGVDCGEPETGTLTTPKKLAVTSAGKLEPQYHPAIEARFGPDLTNRREEVKLMEAGDLFGTSGSWTPSQDGVHAISNLSWSARRIDIVESAFVMEANVSLKRGRAAGLIVKDNLAALLDFREQAVIFASLPRFIPIDKREYPLQFGVTYVMRVLAKSEFFEVYLNDTLLMTFIRYKPEKGRFGLFVESGEAQFRQVRIAKLFV